MSHPYPIEPIFRSHYSLCSSLLSLEEPGKAKPGNSRSVFDCVKEAPQLTEVTLVDSRIDGFIQAYKTAAKVGVRLCYGIQFTVCHDCADKAVDSRHTESDAIVFVRGGALNEYGLPAGYTDLVRIWNRAWGHEGHITYRLGQDEFSYGRTDWTTLKRLWTPNLMLALPYTSSFIARNTLSFRAVTPDLPMSPWVFSEQDSGLPQAPLIDRAIARYIVAEPSAKVLPTKTICYETAADFEPYVTLRAFGMGGSWEDPGVRGLCSDTWSWQRWKELVGISATVTASPAIPSPSS